MKGPKEDVSHEAINTTRLLEPIERRCSCDRIRSKVLYVDLLTDREVWETTIFGNNIN